MKKPFNLRLPVLYAAALIAGIVYSAVLAYFGLSGLFILIPALLFAAACIPVVIIKGRAAGTLIFIFAAVLFVVGAIYTYAEYFLFTQTELPPAGSVKITGKVVEKGLTSEGSRYVIIGNAYAGDIKLRGKVVAYLSDTAGDYCGRGYLATFNANLEKQNFFAFGEINYNAVRGVKYSCSVSEGFTAQYRFSLFGTVAEAMERALFDNLAPNTAGVCFAMLTGNTQSISADTLTAFRNGGIAHIFAVSGLHIGVIYGALTFIFKKAGVNRFAGAAVKITLIALYAGVCGFAPSSVRAVIVCSVSSAAACCRRKYDGLNALSLAALVLLAIYPLDLFDAGFLLSFGGVLGIIMLGGGIRRAIFFLPKKPGGALATAISVQIATAPALLTSFGKVSAVGLLLNVAFIPVISAIYVIVFVCTALGALFPALASAVLPSVCLPLEFIINLVTAAGFDNAALTGDFSDWLFVPFIIIVAALSGKFNLRALTRVSACFFFATLLLIYAVSPVANAPRFAFYGGYSGGCALINAGSGNVLVVTDDYKGRDNFADLDIRAVVVAGGDDNLSVLSYLGIKCERAYVRGGAVQVPWFGDIPITYADEFECSGVKFTFGSNALTARAKGVSVAVVLSRGGEYGADLTSADFNLYCRNSDGAILFNGNKNYALKICGKMTYMFKGRGYYPSFAVPHCGGN